MWPVVLGSINMILTLYNKNNTTPTPTAILITSNRPIKSKRERGRAGEQARRSFVHHLFSFTPSLVQETDTITNINRHRQWYKPTPSVSERPAITTIDYISNTHSALLFLFTIGHRQWPTEENAGISAFIQRFHLVVHFSSLLDIDDDQHWQRRHWHVVRWYISFHSFIFF